MNPRPVTVNFQEQHGLFADAPVFCSAIKPVNVASVPQRSPFRYPGGKTWLVPTFRQWIQSLDEKPELLVDHSLFDPSCRE